jgi:hypothetical protein
MGGCGPWVGRGPNILSLLDMTTGPPLVAIRFKGAFLGKQVVVVMSMPSMIYTTIWLAGSEMAQMVVHLTAMQQS